MASLPGRVDRIATGPVRVQRDRGRTTLRGMRTQTPPSPNEPTQLDLPGADVRLWLEAFPPAQAEALFRSLRRSIGWQQEHVTIFGARRLVPRLVAWYGDPGTAYTYSGTQHEPKPWTAELSDIRQVAEALTSNRYNSVLLNLYRDGHDGMGWHADDEPELGCEPAIASVSFGATRRFRLRHRQRRGDACALDLEPGSVLLMAGATQTHYIHAVPKTARAVGERINLTFRNVTTQRRWCY
jgi:alkylated DNA repair dioxygenase AlkB